MTQIAISCAVMRGGTSKGLMFLAGDLPDDRATRDAVLLAAMGSPDERQIMRWNGNPYELDGGSANGGSEDDGSAWLLPYWMGRYHRLIAEKDGQGNGR